MSYASGKHSFGICDRTGLRYKFRNLVYEIENGRRNGLRVGKDIVDRDHPQNKLSKARVHDPQSLKDPRPEASEGSSTISNFLTTYPHTAGSSS